MLHRPGRSGSDVAEVVEIEAVVVASEALRCHDFDFCVKKNL